MKILKCLKSTYLETKNHLKDNNFDSLLWLVNILSNLVGISLHRDKIAAIKHQISLTKFYFFAAPFWILHLSLLVYVYGVGNVVYQVKFAQSPTDFIKSYVNILILITAANSSYWFLTKRSLLKIVLKTVNKSDELASRSLLLRTKHKKSLFIIKKMLLIFYGFNLIDAFLIYIPHRIDLFNDNYAMTLCVGLEPLTASPNQEICRFILCVQELINIIVILDYQGLLFLLIAHTALMYQMLAEELTTLANSDENIGNAKETLPKLIDRHIMILDTVANLKSLYSVSIGVNFGINALCMCIFCFLSLQEYVIFMPMLLYCFVVFFLYCYLCQKLINASEEFERAVYSCGWENLELRDKKSIYIMLLQAQRPVELLAANIIPINIATFATTIQAMYKFVTVVKF